MQIDFIAILVAVLVLGALGAAFGIILGIAGKKFEVKIDPRISAVRECLGGANCGACGFAGCDAFAEAVVNLKASPNGCPPGGQASAEAIGKILGIDVPVGEPMVARVMCMGTSGIAKKRYEYDGYASCRIATSMAGGPKQCAYSCIGLGDCIDACSFNGISIEDGVAKIDANKCKGCGECVVECPRSAIRLTPRSATVNVRCRNADIGRTAVNVCMKACIGCKRCETACNVGAISVVNGCASIDYDKCTRCGECARVCPRGCITDEVNV
ncbi:MAG: RnfABCDGE type electron transport complex subunit B [Clostridia bacterium]